MSFKVRTLIQVRCLTLEWPVSVVISEIVVTSEISQTIGFTLCLHFL